MLGKIVSPRLEKLEKEFLESGGEWKEFRIGELFKIGTGSLLSSEELKTGKIKRVSAKSFDNGIIGEYDTESNDRARHFENFISVNFFGDVFYHPYCASVEMKVHTLKLKDMEFNNKTGVYFASVIKKSLANKFGYGNQLSSSKLKELDFRISVPLLNGKINFSYMEKFIEELEALRIEELEALRIEELEALRIEELEAYLVATGLKNYRLTKYDEEVLDKFNRLSETSLDRQTDRIDRFILENLFIAETGDVDLQQSDINGRGTYFINSGLQNNGIKGRTDKLAKIFPANTITVDFWGNVFYRNFDYKMATHNHVFSLSGVPIKNEQVGLYLVSSMSYLSKIYSYNDMGTWNKMKKLEIEVPTLNGKIDYKFMEDFIYAIEKLVIKDVVIWADKKISATKQVADRN